MRSRPAAPAAVRDDRNRAWADEHFSQPPCLNTWNAGELPVPESWERLGTPCDPSAAMPSGGASGGLQHPPQRLVTPPHHRRSFSASGLPTSQQTRLAAFRMWGLPGSPLWGGDGLSSGGRRRSSGANQLAQGWLGGVELECFSGPIGACKPRRPDDSLVCVWFFFLVCSRQRDVIPHFCSCRLMSQLCLQEPRKFPRRLLRLPLLLVQPPAAAAAPPVKSKASRCSWRQGGNKPVLGGSRAPRHHHHDDIVNVVVVTLWRNSTQQQQQRRSMPAGSSSCRCHYLLRILMPQFASVGLRRLLPRKSGWRRFLLRLSIPAIQQRAGCRLLHHWFLVPSSSSIVHQH